MRRRINLCDIFVMLWGIYYLQGILYSPGILNQIVQLIMIVLGLYAMVHYILRGTKSNLLNAVVVLVIMYSIYGVYIILYGDGLIMTSDTTYLKNSLNSLLPIFFFYNQTKLRNLEHNRIHIYTIFILVVTIARYYYNSQQVMDERNADEITNNIGYWFVFIIPFIYFFRQRVLLQYFLLAVIVLYIFMGMKRGAIVVGCISALIFLYSNIRDVSRSKKLVIITISFLILFGVIYYVELLLTTSDYFVSRVNDTISGNDSGRGILYYRIWTVITNEQDLFKILFGHGANSTVRFAGNFAHQDWLETICNNGLIGGVILLNFFIAFGRSVCKSKKCLPSYLFHSFITLFFICISITLFSMSIQCFSICQSMLIGHLECQLIQNKANI